MAVELQELYEAVQSSYDIKLRTKSCYGKSVDWVHMVEETEFIPLLHGGELALTTALKNAILYPENDEIYRIPFEKNVFFDNMVYHIAVVGGDFSHIEKKIKLQMKRCITCMVDEELVILLAGYQKDEVLDELNQICKNKKNVCVGLGSTVNRMKEIHVSFQNAMLAYKLTNPNSDSNILDYEKLGVYKIITGVKEQNVCDAFVEEVLGKLIEYDRNNKVPLLQVLEAYFENECSIVYNEVEKYKGTRLKVPGSFLFLRD